MRLVPAITERDYGWDERDVRLTAAIDGDGLRLNGAKAYVFDGESASHYLVAVRSEETEEVGLVGGSCQRRGRALSGSARLCLEPGRGCASTTYPPDSTNVLGRPNALLTSPPEGGEYKAGLARMAARRRQSPSRSSAPTRSAAARPSTRSPSTTAAPASSSARPSAASQRVQDQVHRAGQPPRRRPLDHLRGPVEAGRGPRRRQQRQPVQGRRQRGLLRSLQLRPRSARRRRQHDRVRPHPAHRRLPDPLPLPGRPQAA